MEEPNWAQAEKVYVGVDEFTNAQKAQLLRQQIHQYAYLANRYGHVDRDWINARLNRAGAELITGKSTYKLNVPISGLMGATVTANNRAEAVERFNAYVQNVVAAGQLNSGSVYQVVFDGTAPQFYSGPLDPPEQEDGPELDLQGLRTFLRDMLMEGVAEKGWRHSAAIEAVAEMGLEPLPPLVHKSVEVPVSGTHRLDVTVFEGADDDTVQRAAHAKFSKAELVPVKPDEVGEATWARPSAGSETMGLTLVDDDLADDDGDVF